MKLALTISALVALVFMAACGRRGEEQSPHPDQDKYEFIDSQTSSIAIFPDPNVSEVEWAVNSASDFLHSVVYEAEDTTSSDDRSFGIDHLKQGDTITLRSRLKTGGVITTPVKLAESVTLPAKISISANGSAELKK